MTGKDTLNSWKEISRYLNRDVRTCQRWEREFSLPVHRLEGSSRPRVFAYRREIDDWLHHRNRPREKRRFPRKALFLISVFILAAAGILFFRWRSPGPPVDFDIQGSKLVIKDEKGRRIWSYDTGRALLRPEEDYREHFQRPQVTKSSERVQLMPWLIIRDIDGDGKSEVLFAPLFIDNSQSDAVLCFSHRKRLLWRYKAGRRIRYGDREYPDRYRISGLGAEDLDGDGRCEILVISRQVPLFPSPVSLLDSRGNLTGEYWNSGAVTTYAFADLNEDGRKEIVLGGMNNEWRAAAGIVLDSSRVRGASPQSRDYYQAADLETGHEIYYFLFPRNSVDDIDHITNFIGNLHVEENHTLVFMTGICPVAFELDVSMRLLGIDFSHSFMNAHRLYSEDGRLDLNQDRIQAEILERGLRYFDGNGWTPYPSPLHGSR